jgi:hypothetical protein
VSQNPNFPGFNPRLTVEIENLEKKCCMGILSREQCLEQIAAMEARTYQKEIHPLRRRGMSSFLIGFALLLVWTSVEYVYIDLVDFLGAWVEIIPLMAIMSLIFAAVFLNLYFKRLEAYEIRFSRLRGIIRGGGQFADFSHR